MNAFKTIFKGKGSRVWFIVTAAVIVLLTVVSILTTTIFYPLLNTVMPGGGVRAVYGKDSKQVYTADYDNKTDMLNAANLTNEKICEEGFVLLKNQKINEFTYALPLKTSVSDKTVTAKPKVSVFGKNSQSIALGGSGSGAASLSGSVGLYGSLEQAGYELNPTLVSFYKNDSQSGNGRPKNPSDLDSGKSVNLYTGETPYSSYTADIEGSYANYNDAAFVVFTRIGGEGFDLPRYMGSVSGAANATDHYLQLDRNETDLLTKVCNANFKRVVVIINSGSAMELTFLTDSDYFADSDKIDAAIWMGFPGTTGARALGKILSGEVNPSGKTTDTYAADLTAAPSFANFGDNNFGDAYDANKIIITNDMYKLDGTTPQSYYFTDYEEGIYVGYRYYETRGLNNDEWYNDNVVFPFGYGLSYTNFEWEIANKSSIKTDITAKGTVTVEVTVTNTGAVAGRDVVELYVTTPYKPGEIEKAHKVLAAFDKTDILEPNASQTLTLSFNPYDIASYDYKDANENKFKGYELDAGKYIVSISRTAHDVAEEIELNLTAGIKYESDTKTNYKVKNLYTDQKEYMNSDEHLGSVLSRYSANGDGFSLTWPKAPTDADRSVDRNFLNAMADVSHNNTTNFDEIEMPWFDTKGDLKLMDLRPDTDVALDGSPLVDYEDPRWGALLDQCDTKELIQMVNYGAFQSEAVASVSKPKTLETDGPVGFVNFMDTTGSTFYGTCSYCCEVVVASTWNVDRATDFGVSVGNEGIIGNAKQGTPYSGWYAPGANIHRSPFGGRNFEYFAEDSLMSGKMSAAVIQGAQSKGVYCYMKHFALNEQETHRSIGGNAGWVTEQALREIYLKPFEIAVKEGGSRAMMTSFTRIGTRWTGGDYRLITEILRNEWGFRGAVICDFNTVGYMNSRQMAFAGGDLNLATLPKSWCDETNKEDAIILRQCAKNILYTVVNSNAREVIGYNLPIWTVILIIFDCVTVVGLGTWGFFAVRKSIKKQKANLKI